MHSQSGFDPFGYHQGDIGRREPYRCTADGARHCGGHELLRARDIGLVAIACEIRAVQRYRTALGIIDAG
jgi:hypothetical protein